MIEAVGPDPPNVSPRKILTATLLPLAAVAAAALASGCGGAGAGAVVDPVAQAAETTSGAPGARIAMRIQVSVAGQPQQFTLSAHGRITFKTEEGEMQLETNGAPGASASPLDGATITELFTGGKIFVRTPLFAGKLPGGASWVELNLDAAVRELGLNPQSLTSGQANPTQFLEYLRARGGNVAAIGTARIRGVDTTHYAGTIDFSKVPDADAPAVKALLAELRAATGSSSVPVQAWIDSHKLIRRFTIQLPVTAAGQSIGTAVTVDFYDFGPQAAVVPPAGSETYELDPSKLPSAGLGG